jgi:hypothetical protein
MGVQKESPDVSPLQVDLERPRMSRHSAALAPCRSTSWKVSAAARAWYGLPL